MRLIPHHDIIVIGSGVGGLITSTLLSRSGFNTLLIEKNEVCGGRMNSEYLYTNNSTNNCVIGNNNNNDNNNNNTSASSSSSSYRFDVGPSLLLLPDVYNDTFYNLGANMKDYIQLLEVEPLYRCYFEEDQTFADISNNSTKMEITFNSIDNNNNNYQKYLEYMSIASDFLRFGLPVVIEEKWTSINWQHFYFFFCACLKIFPLFSHDYMLNQFFPTSNKIKAMMSFQDLYIGLSPYQAPAVFSLLQALEFEKGIFYPQGGFQKIAQAFELIARQNGVELMMNCTLKSINIQNNDSGNTIDTTTTNTNNNSNRGISSNNNDNSKSSTTNGSTDIVTTNSPPTNIKLHSINVSTRNAVTGVHEIQTLSADTFVTNIDAPAFESYFIRSSSSSSRSDSDSSSNHSSSRSDSDSGSNHHSSSSSRSSSSSSSSSNNNSSSRSISSSSSTNDNNTNSIKTSNNDNNAKSVFTTANQYTDTRTATGKPSCSVISLHFALNRKLQSLTHHTLYLSRHYHDSWKAVENEESNTNKSNIVNSNNNSNSDNNSSNNRNNNNNNKGKVEFNADAFNFYIHAPSRTDASVCPLEHDAITILVPIPPIPVTTATSGAVITTTVGATATSIPSAVTATTDTGTTTATTDTGTTTATTTTIATSTRDEFSVSEQQQRKDFIAKVRTAVIGRLNEMENAYLNSHNHTAAINDNNNIHNHESIDATQQASSSSSSYVPSSSSSSIPSSSSSSVNIEDYIIAEKIRDAYHWQQEFTLFRGSVFGLTHSLNQLAFLRPKIRHPYLPNLYRVGASVRPGNGVPLVMIGAKLTAQTIDKDCLKNGNKRSREKR